MPVSQKDTESAKPFLRWAGSKRKQTDRLSLFWSGEHLRYVEPFAGSACLFFTINPKNALIADNNCDLIDTYRTVQKFPEQVFDAVDVLPRTPDTYYRIRSQHPGDLPPIERATRFIFLNRNCFNGIYRTNRAGQFNVPFATSRAGRFLTKEEFLTTAKRLEVATLEAWDFETTLNQVGIGDFVYLDPPYAVNSRRIFKEYGNTPFTENDLDRLAELLDQISARGASFLVSYADCAKSRAIGQKWKCKRMRVRRHIAGFTGARRSAYEVLITNIDR